MKWSHLHQSNLLFHWISNYKGNIKCQPSHDVKLCETIYWRVYKDLINMHKTRARSTTYNFEIDANKTTVKHVATLTAIHDVWGWCWHTKIQDISPEASFALSWSKFIVYASCFHWHSISFTRCDSFLPLQQLWQRNHLHLLCVPFLCTCAACFTSQFETFYLHGRSSSTMLRMQKYYLHDYIVKMPA